MIDAIQLEKLGKPTVTIIQDRFEKAARLHAKAGGLSEIAFVIEPAPEQGSVARDVEGLVKENMPVIVRALTTDMGKG